MGGMFQFNELEILTFFAILVRLSVLVSVAPWLGDRSIPGSVKILLSLCITVLCFPALLSRGWVRVSDAAVWGATASGIARVIGLEVITGLILGFVAKLAFEAVQIGGTLVGNFMGYSSASIYDPHVESQSQIIAQFQSAIAMLIFLVLDGHHLVLRALLESYQTIGLGGAQLFGGTAATLIQLSGQVLKIALILSAPIAVVIFGINVAFGMIGRALPQTNLLVLSFGVIALGGFAVLLLSLPEFISQVQLVFERSADWIREVSRSLAADGGGK